MSELGIPTWPKPESDKTLAEIIKELEKFGAEHDNHLEVITHENMGDYPQDLRPEILKAAQADDQADIVALMFDKVKEHVANVIIKDSFGKDHHARRAWENNVLPKAPAQLVDLYNKNALQISDNYLTPAISVFEPYVANSSELEKIAKAIPESFQAKSGGSLDDDSLNLDHEFAVLDTEDKIKEVLKTQKLSADLLKLIGEERRQ